MLRLLAFAIGITLIAGFAKGQSDNLPALRVTEYKLKNGLTVVLHEDRSAPTVSVTLLYKVGSKNEQPGKTGLAHLFEHLMAMGSKNHNYRTGPAQELGSGTGSAYITRDKTVCHTVVPTNYLEGVLYLEADRMSGLLDVMEQSKLDFQRDVVRNVAGLEPAFLIQSYPDAAHAGVALFALDVGDHSFGGERQSCDRGCVLKCDAGEHGAVDDTGG